MVTVTGGERRPVELVDLYDDLDLAERGWRTSVLSFAVVKASRRTADALGIAEGAAVYAIERLRHARNVPLALMRHQVPASVASFSREDLERQGMREILHRHGAAAQFTREKVGARAATTAEARILDEARGALLLTLNRISYDERGRAVERGFHVYRASLFTFEVGQASG